MVAIELYFDSWRGENYPFAHTRERLIYEQTRLALRHPFLTNATSGRYERTSHLYITYMRSSTMVRRINVDCIMYDCCVHCLHIRNYRNKHHTTHCFQMHKLIKYDILYDTNICNNNQRKKIFWKFNFKYKFFLFLFRT